MNKLIAIFIISILNFHASADWNRHFSGKSIVAIQNMSDLHSGRTVGKISLSDDTAMIMYTDKTKSDKGTIIIIFERNGKTFVVPVKVFRSMGGGWLRVDDPDAIMMMRLSTSMTIMFNDVATFVDMNGANEVISALKQ